MSTWSVSILLKIYTHIRTHPHTHLGQQSWLFQCTGVIKRGQRSVSSTTWASCQIRKSAGAHAPGMPGTFSPPPRVSDPDMHHGTCVTHVPWCEPGSLTSGLLWSQWWGKRSRHSWFYVSVKRSMVGSGFVQRWILSQFGGLIHTLP